MREHYAEAFSVRDGCFRLVADTAGRSEHCQETPVWVGTFQDAGGRNHTVRACDGHRAGLVNVRRIEDNQAGARQRGEEA